MLTAGRLKEIITHERPRVLSCAEGAMQESPATITAYPCPHSPGSSHDYYSEAPYAWPNPDDPDGPYVSRDGVPNPDRFHAHQRAVTRLNTTVGALVAARLITADPQYAGRAISHLRAWFIESTTRMNPGMAYAQAKRNVRTGSAAGIIDAKHFVETLQAVHCLRELNSIDASDVQQLRAWFGELMSWLNTHPLGQKERDATNNHGIYWALLVSSCAKLTGDQAMLAQCRNMFRDRFVGKQMAQDGSFPREINRTRPLGYSIFALNGLAMLCQLLSTADENLWTFELPDGRGMRCAMEYLYPSLADPGVWPHAQDVEDFEVMPGRPIALLLAGLAYDQADYLALWHALEEPSPDHDWHNRAVCARQPILWLPVIPHAGGETLAHG